MIMLLIYKNDINEFIYILQNEFNFSPEVADHIV